MSVATLYCGDAREVLARLPAESVHCVVSSPPYWGLRDYGLEPQVWGGDVGCAHEWADQLTIHKGGASGGGAATEGRDQSARNAVKDRDAGAYCGWCDAWRGHLGLEPTPELYLEHMVTLFREVRRVLRKDGTLWLNMGDCYATGAGRVGEHPGGGEQGARWKGEITRHRDARRRPHGQPKTNGRGEAQRPRKGSNRAQRGDGNAGVPFGPMTQPNRMPIAGLKPKDLVMMPARLALALQADGWWLRSKIVWEKPNPMPESITDRPTSSYEEVFLLARSERYFYDAAAIAEAASEACSGNKERDIPSDDDGRGIPNDHRGRGVPWQDTGGGRNARNVWTISTQPYPEAHFATFPEELARRCIVAGSSPRTCEQCGAPWRREVVAEGGTIGRAWHDHKDDLERGQRAERAAKGGNYRRIDNGLKPGCKCNGTFERRVLGSGITARQITVYVPQIPLEDHPVGRSVVLDPFGGSGTVAQVATGNGRDSIYIDLNPKYLELASQRIGPMLCRLVDSSPRVVGG